MNAITSISQYKSCQPWIDGLRSSSTKKSYSTHLLLFCRFYDTNPDNLVTLSVEEIKNMVINYVRELKKEAKSTAGKPKMGEKSVNSIKLYLSGVKSFLDEHEISIPWKKISKYYPEDVTNDYRSYSRKEISKLLSIAGPRDRCIILLMASSGIRVGAIPTLIMKSLKRLDHGLGLLTVYGDSLKYRYVTLVTPECMSTIDEYLEDRTRHGEHLNESSYLIRDKYDIYSTRINRPKCLRAGTINAQIRQLIRKAGLAFDELQPDHAFRKFFNTVLFNSKVDGKFKELMMGHSIKLDEFYYDKNDEESRKQIILEYIKAVDALTINDEYRLRKQIIEYEEKLKQVPKVEMLEQQLVNRIIEEDSIKKTVEKLQKEKELQDQYIQERETEMKTMQEQIDHIIEIVKDPHTRARMLIKPTPKGLVEPNERRLALASRLLNKK